MKAEVAILTMNGDKILWFYQVQQQFQFFLAAVPVDMDLCQLVVQDLSPLLEEIVYSPVNQRFIAGNGCCRKHYGIAPLDMNMGMVSVSHAHQG